MGPITHGILYSKDIMHTLKIFYRQTETAYKYTLKLITLANGETWTDHGQWWSILLMQRWQTLQWWARGGRYVSQRLHTVQPSQPWSEPTQWLKTCHRENALWNKMQGNRIPTLPIYRLSAFKYKELSVIASAIGYRIGVHITASLT